MSPSSDTFIEVRYYSITTRVHPFRQKVDSINSVENFRFLFKCLGVTVIFNEPYFYEFMDVGIFRIHS